MPVDLEQLRQAIGWKQPFRIPAEGLVVVVAVSVVAMLKIVEWAKVTAGEHIKCYCCL